MLDSPALNYDDSVACHVDSDGVVYDNWVVERSYGRSSPGTSNDYNNAYYIKTDGDLYVNWGTANSYGLSEHH